MNHNFAKDQVQGSLILAGSLGVFLPGETPVLRQPSSCSFLPLLGCTRLTTAPGRILLLACSSVLTWVLCIPYFPCPSARVTSQCYWRPGHKAENWLLDFLEIPFLFQFYSSFIPTCIGFQLLG